MAAATELLGELGIPARIAAASRDWLAQLTEENRSTAAGAIQDAAAEFSRSGQPGSRNSA
jgi:hypothetical protein